MLQDAPSSAVSYFRQLPKQAIPHQLFHRQNERPIIIQAATEPPEPDSLARTTAKRNSLPALVYPFRRIWRKTHETARKAILSFVKHTKTLSIIARGEKCAKSSQTPDPDCAVF